MNDLVQKWQNWDIQTKQLKLKVKNIIESLSKKTDQDPYTVYAINSIEFTRLYGEKYTWHFFVQYSAIDKNLNIKEKYADIPIEWIEDGFDYLMAYKKMKDIK